MDSRRLVQQFPVEGSQRREHPEFQKDAADEIVEIEDAVISLTAGHPAVMGRQIAHLADIVGGHHQAVIADEGDERLAGHQLIEAGPLRNLDALERVDGLDHPLQAPAAVERTTILVGMDLGLRSLAEKVQVAEFLYLLKIVEVVHA